MQQNFSEGVIGVTVNKQAVIHLQTVLRHTPTDAGFIELRAISKNGDKPETYWLATHAKSEQIHDAVRWSRERSAAGADVFIGYNARKKRGNGTKAGVPTMTAAYLDLDLEKYGVRREDAMAAIENAPIKPHLVVDSGHGFHVITFHEPTADKQTWSLLENSLVNYYKPFGADDGFKPHEAAILRLVPFTNKKDNSPTSIVKISPDAPARVGDLLRAFGSDRRKETKEKKSSNLIATNGIKRIGEVVDLNRNVTLTREAGRLRKYGYDEGEILATLLALNERRCSPPLPEFEVKKIAASIVKYEPDAEDMAVIDEETERSIAVNFGTFAMTAFPNVEPVIFGLRPAQIGTIQAVPNVGKTTMMLNLAVAVAVGRSYEPLYDGGEARRVMYLDFENTASFLQMDMLHMVRVLDEDERASLGENLHIIVDKFINEDPLDLSRKAHFDAVVRQAVERNVEIVIIDTMAEGFSLQNENDNSEMKRMVISPLKKLAKLTNACVLLVHHMGKASEGKSSEALFRGRGASSLAASARLILNLDHMKDGDGRAIKEHVKLVCAKVKGPKFDDRIFRLNFVERWFEPTEIHVAPSEAAQDRILKLVGEPMKRGRVINKAKAAGIVVSEKTIERALAFGIDAGVLRKGPRATFEPTPLWLKRFGTPTGTGHVGKNGNVIPFRAGKPESDQLDEKAA
jgi:hypothetical protein